MRFLSAFLFIALSGSVVLADEAKTAEPKPEQSKPKVPLRVVRMLPDTGQALLFDNSQGTHVVAELGMAIDGFIVEDITDTEVTLSAEDGSLIVLAAPEKKKKKAKGAGAAEPPAAITADPVDPYEGGAAPPAAPSTVTTTTATAPTVTATTTVTVGPSAPTAAAPPATATTAATAAPTAAVPQATPTAAAPTAAPTVKAGSPAIDTSELEPGIAAFVEAVGAVPAPNAAGAAAPASPSSLAPTPAATATPASPGTPIVAALKRTEVDAALGDFSKLSSSFKGGFIAQGLRLDSIVSGSLLAKAGFQKGDVVTSVDGKQLHSLDDVADLYALAWTSNSATVQILRGGKPTTLRLAIQ